MMNMSITDNLKIAGQYCLPKHALSRLIGKFAAVEAGAISADRFHNYHRILETMQEARHGRQQARL